MRNHVPLSQIRRSCCPLCLLESPEVHRLSRLGSAWVRAEAGGPSPNFLTADLRALSVGINTLWRGAVTKMFMKSIFFQGSREAFASFLQKRVNQNLNLTTIK